MRNFVVSTIYALIACAIVMSGMALARQVSVTHITIGKQS